MKGAEKNRASDDPKQDRQPAEPHPRENGADDRARGRDGGKMLAQKKPLGGRDIINTVVDFTSRRFFMGVEFKMPGQKTGIESVSEDKYPQDKKDQINERHYLSFLFTPAIMHPQRPVPRTFPDFLFKTPGILLSIRHHVLLRITGLDQIKRLFENKHRATGRLALIKSGNDRGSVFQTQHRGKS